MNPGPQYDLRCPWYIKLSTVFGSGSLLSVLYFVFSLLHFPQAISVPWDNLLSPFCLVLSFFSFPNLPSLIIIVTIIIVTIY